LALAQLFDELIQERAIDVGEHVGILRRSVAQRVGRCLEVVVAGVYPDAKARRDVGSFPSVSGTI